MDKVGIDDKSLKDKKKNENKAWLSQRLSELGEDRIIYTSNSTGRHPYTKEVLLLAERQGSRQADMAEACEVSQSQISQWMSGQSKATNEQLEPLIDLISPLMPGRSFFIEKIVKEVVFKLPDDWEEKAVAAFLRKKASNMPGFDPASIQQSAYGGVVSEEQRSLAGLKKDYESERQVLGERKGQLEILMVSHKQEAADYEKGLIVWGEHREQYLVDNPELAKLEERERNTMLDRHYQEPIKSNEAQVALLEFLTDELSSDASKDDVDKGFQLVLNKLMDELSELESGYPKKCAKAGGEFKKEREVRKVFARYSSEINIKEIQLAVDFNGFESEFKRIAADLYGGLMFTLAYEARDSWSNERKQHDVMLNMEDAFVNFCMNLAGESDIASRYIDVSYEEVQVCGEHISGIPIGKSGLEDSADFTGIRCYRLFGNKLALIHRFTCSSDEDDFDYYQNLHVFDNADSALKGVGLLQKFCDLSGEKINVLQHDLVKSGYKTPGYRSIY